jgi:hypothetical protein
VRPDPVKTGLKKPGSKKPDLNKPGSKNPDSKKLTLYSKKLAQ